MKQPRALSSDVNVQTKSSAQPSGAVVGGSRDSPSVASSLCVQGIQFLLASAGLTYLTVPIASFSSRAAEFLSLAAFFTLIQILSLNLTESIQ